MQQRKNWLITGCSSGFGKSFAKYILQQGDRVAVTARDLESLNDFKSFGDQALLLPLDVRSAPQRFETIQKILAHWGTLDVLVNNAGFGILGAFEDIPETALREIFETNFFALVEMSRLVLPSMRKNRSGWIVNLSSIAGLVASPAFSAYNATKFAVEGFSEALRQEVASFGIYVTVVEPGPFRTDFFHRSLKKYRGIGDYEKVLAAQWERLDKLSQNLAGDPECAAAQIFQSSRQLPPPPRLLMGKFAFERYQKFLQERLQEIEARRQDIISTDFDSL